jgi:hypothetical protein
VGAADQHPGHLGDARGEAIAGRLVVAAGNVVAFSEADNRSSLQRRRLPRAAGRRRHHGPEAIEDTLLVFTNFGLWSITNMAYNLTDAAGNVQQSLSLLVPELSWSTRLGCAAGRAGSSRRAWTASTS